MATIAVILIGSTTSALPPPGNLFDLPWNALSPCPWPYPHRGVGGRSKRRSRTMYLAVDALVVQYKELRIGALTSHVNIASLPIDPDHCRISLHFAY
jgi:hypothetical protein